MVVIRVVTPAGGKYVIQWLEDAQVAWEWQVRNRNPGLHQGKCTLGVFLLLFLPPNS